MRLLKIKEVCQNKFDFIKNFRDVLSVVKFHINPEVFLGETGNKLNFGHDYPMQLN